MAVGEQSESERYRVIVLGRGGMEILLVPNGERQILPWVEIPRWQRVAENLTGAMKSDWGEEVVCLFEPATDPRTDGGVPRYQAAEHLRTCGNPKMPRRWVPLSTLCPDSVTDACDYRVIKQVVTMCNKEVEGASAGPFVRLGWFCELRNWIESVVEPMGFRLTERFQQSNAADSFSLIRFETSGPALWFKAVGEPNQREFPITCALAGLFPRCLPCILATRPDWNGWLMREAEGKMLCDAQGYVSWQRVAAELAELQVGSTDEAQAIFLAGARDMRPDALFKQIQPLLDTAQRLMGRQTKTPPPILQRKELLLLADHIREAFDSFESLEIPDAIGHLDFNPGNVVVSANGCIFLDWAEAYVGNPFLTFQYLLEHFRRVRGNDVGQEAELVESYVAPWLRILSREVIDAAMNVSPLLAVFSYAVAAGMLTDKHRLEDPQFAGYLRSLVRRIDREARLWADRSGKCSAHVAES